MEERLFQLFDQMDKHPIIPAGMFLFIIVTGYLNWRKKRVLEAIPEDQAPAVCQTSAQPDKQVSKRPARRQQQRRDLLSDTLFHWSSRDTVKISDILRSTAIFGATGAGKSSGSGRFIAKALARHHKVGGIALASKPEDRRDWQRIFHEAGRPADLIVFNPESPYRFNFIDYMHQMGGDARDITEAITVIGETLDQGENLRDKFWEKEPKRLIHNAVQIVRLAKGRVTAPDLHAFISGAAMKPEITNAPEFKDSLHGRYLRAAYHNAKTAIEKHDFGLAFKYWKDEFPGMADKMRSGILTSVMGILHVFGSGIVRELVSTTTNLTPAVMDQGMWILVDMPISSYGAAGAFILGGFKYLAQRHILHRHVTEDTAACIIWADEAQKVVNSFDAAYLGESRSHKGALIYLTQSIHAYYTRLREGGDHEADSFLTNFYTKIFHAVGDDKTAHYASSLIGRRERLWIETSSSGQEGGIWEALYGQPKVSSSTRRSMENIVENREFMQGLRTGGAEHGYVVDGIVVRSGQPFSNGEAYLKVAFNQKG